jgi:hypothetical protein
MEKKKCLLEEEFVVAVVVRVLVVQHEQLMD